MRCKPIVFVATLMVINTISACGGHAPAPSSLTPEPMTLEQEQSLFGWPYRLGVNFLLVEENPPEFNTLTAVLDDLKDLGAVVIRQTTSHDVGWANVFDKSTESYDFSGPDELFQTISDGGYKFLVIPTLFQIGPDAGFGPSLLTPEGVKVTDPSVLGEVRAYIRDVALGCSEHTKYFEIANEAKQYDAGADPAMKFLAADYAELLEICRDVFDSVDPDIKIVLGSLAGTEYDIIDNQLDWLKGVINALRADGVDPEDYIDVIGFHYYDEWGNLNSFIDKIKSRMGTGSATPDPQDAFGFSKPIWLTEVGRSHVAASKDIGADYGRHEDGDSESEQARDIFRKLTVAFGDDVQLVIWHTHFCKNEDPGDKESGGGLRHDDGSKTSAWFTYQLFARELGRFRSCTKERTSTDVNLYRYIVPASGNFYYCKWVFWANTSLGSPLTVDLSSVLGGSSVKVTSTVPVTLMAPAGTSAGRATPWFITKTIDPGEIEVGPTPLLIEDGVLHHF